MHLFLLERKVPSRHLSHFCSWGLKKVPFGQGSLHWPRLSTTKGFLQVRHLSSLLQVSQFFGQWAQNLYSW